MDWRRVFLEPAVLVAIVVTVGLAVYFSQTTGPDQGTLAVIAALVGLAVTLQVQLLSRERRRNEHHSLLCTLASRLERRTWLKDVDDVTQVAERVDNIFGSDPVELLWEMTNDQFGSFGGGRLELNSHDHSVAVRLVGKAQRSMCAISVPAEDLAFWDTDEGKQYWDLQVEAMRNRDVKIRRVVIYDEWLPELERLATKHTTAGVTVRRVHRTELDGKLVKITAVWDDRWANTVSNNPFSDTDKAIFTVHPDDVARMKDKFEQVWSQARPFQYAAAG